MYKTICGEKCEDVCKTYDAIQYDYADLLSRAEESICGDFVDAIGYCRITDFENFYGNFAKVEYQWEVFPTEEDMICW